MLLGLGFDARRPRARNVTPLHLAAFGGHSEVAELLLAAGADPSVRDTAHGGRPTEWAVHAGHTELAERLRAAAGT